MATTPFTLAALATSAVPGLSVTGTRPHTSGSAGNYTSAALSTDRGDVIVRIPAVARAEVQQSAELLGLGALAEGARTKLPFAVPTTLGITRAGDTRAVVSTFLPGAHVSMDHLESDPELLRSAAEAVAAIHLLPVSIVREGGLASRDAAEVQALASRLVKRAIDTGMLPETVRARWQEVLASAAVWSFETTVVHGSLSEDALLIEGSAVTGVLGWSELSLGDPAADLAWFLSGDEGTFESVLAHYSLKRSVGGQHEFVARARFYHELEVAKWLLHGVESHDQSIIDDAVSMFDRLVDRISLHGAALPQKRVLSELEVEQMLDSTPQIDHDPRSETAEYESLDEDRAFGVDGDFEDDGNSRGSRDASGNQAAGDDAHAAKSDASGGKNRDANDVAADDDENDEEDTEVITRLPKE